MQYTPSNQGFGQELQRISEALERPRESISLTPLSVAPPKPRDGVIAMADGVNWNPGAGAGFYGYRAGSWRFLG